MKTRFAPSPTGLLHLGNVRTALFNYLLARHHRGVFLLRLEDTDAARGEERYEQALQADLQWLGLDWHEGPGRDAGNGPYWQSERGDIYHRYFEQLREQGLAYPCFCSEHELKLSRKAQLAAGETPRYSGRCHGLSQAEVEARRAAGTPATLRFHVDDAAVIEFTDKVRGQQHFRGHDIGDFIIRRSDGTPAFFFSNAVDDALMGVTLVVRGEDHLSNTPRQLLLLQALGLPAPEYAHIALVVGQDGAPLSKRHGSQTVQDLREAGYLPTALTNYLARLGHTYREQGFMSLDELAMNIDIDHLHKSPARYDPAQLQYWQKEAIAHLSDQELWAWMCRFELFGGHVQNYVPEDLAMAFVQTIRDNITSPHDAFLWAGNLFAETGHLDSVARETIREAGRDFFHTALTCLEQAAGDYKVFTQAVGKASGRKGKSLFLPLRAALTGEIGEHIPGSSWSQGPELARVWDLLGQDRIRRRLQLAEDECQS